MATGEMRDGYRRDGRWLQEGQEMDTGGIEGGFRRDGRCLIIGGMGNDYRRGKMVTGGVRDGYRRVEDGYRRNARWIQLGWNMITGGMGDGYRREGI